MKVELGQFHFQEMPPHDFGLRLSCLFSTASDLSFLSCGPFHTAAQNMTVNFPGVGLTQREKAPRKPQRHKDDFYDPVSAVSH